MKRLKGIIGKVTAIAALAVMAPAASYALPTLQLDIAGGRYDKKTQTIVAAGNPFTLYAFLDINKYNTVDDTYYLSAAISPQYGPNGGDLGSFEINGQTINVTSGMNYGVPPLETFILPDPGDLPTHGVFPTYFREFEIHFNPANLVAGYNTAIRAANGDPLTLTPISSNGMYYQAFSIDTANLSRSFYLHFDLYNTSLKNGDVDVTKFAPFSHDAESGRAPATVPEPSSLILMGFGLLTVWGLWSFYRPRLRGEGIN